MIATLLAKFKALGPQRFFLAGVSGATNLILQKLYRFDRWHIGGNYHSRPYKARVVALAEYDQAQTVVEIGAGLCDIIGRVMARERVGLDLDDKVLKAARHLVPRDVKLACANFLDAPSVIAALRAQSVQRIDCLILVNWIHMISMDEIEVTLRAITRVIPIRHVLFDAIRPGASGYRFHHNAADFRRLGRIKETVAGDDVRDLVMVDMTALL